MIASTPLSGLLVFLGVLGGLCFVGIFVAMAIDLRRGRQRVRRHRHPLDDEYH